jgi:deazaflavin-dependent oxidoreductase (nitroreductase family)
MARLGAAVLALVALGSPVGAAAPTRLAAALDQVRDRSTLEIVTVGRRTGKRHTRPIWFVVAHGSILVQAGKDGRTDWYRNLRANPDVTARVGGYSFRARAVPVEDPARVEGIHRLFLDKYTSAWLFSFVGSGIGRGLPVELVPEGVEGPS